MCRHCRKSFGHPTHTANGEKETFLQSLMSILYFGAVQSSLFMKCYSHNMVVGAVYVCSCILEHHCAETWEDRNHFPMEPDKPVILREVMEMRTDDVECPIHYTISRSRVEIRDLPNYNMRRFHHTVYTMQLYTTRRWKGPKNIFDMNLSPTTHAEVYMSKYWMCSCKSPGLSCARVVYLSIFCQLCQELIHIFQRIALLKLLKYTVN